jgi:uracil phosphoribosyltransferase
MKPFYNKIIVKARIIMLRLFDILEKDYRTQDSGLSRIQLCSVFCVLSPESYKKQTMKTTILDTPYNLTLLAKLGQPDVFQPEIDRLIKNLYTNVFGYIADNELEQEKISVKTRICTKDKRGVFQGSVFKKNQKAVVADVIRGGIQPSHIFYIKLTEILNPKYVRQDHIMSQRIETKNGVTGTSLMSSKIGGSVNGAIVFIPDPMGATGHSATEVIDFYQKKFGHPKKFVIVNLVITPQYIKKLEKIDAPIHLYATRLDKGLTKDDFIYPGLGGVGEMISNTKK